ncbi:MAG: Smr/MutS family protein [Bacteroidia bacterium]|nr:Smr/MutS family protein [Bacteroidia bacterium]
MPAKKHLFFIDEFGTGTDPQFGGPIAESVLMQLANKQAFGVVTTHYSNIKTFANNTKGMLNASMLFDSENMVPLYVLETGKPGSSHAFEIAQRTGFPKHILDYARARSGHKQLNVDDLLLNLQQDRIEINRLKEENEKRDKELHKLLQEYNKKNEEIQQQKKILIQQAKEQALQIVKNANSLIEQTIKEIKTTGAEPVHTKQVREELKQFGEELKKEIAVETAKQPAKEIRLKPVDEKITVGSFVKIKENNSTGQVIEISKNKAVVSIGELRTTIDLARLESTTAPPKEKNKPAYGVSGLDMTEKYRGFNTELNIIGERGEDAVRQLKVFIDEAYLLGFKNVRIVHGKGDGILRKLVTEELKRNELVISFNEAHAETGGAGATVVEIK